MTGDQGDAPSAFYNGPIPRLGIPELRMADATDGIASRGWSLPETGDRATAMPAGDRPRRHLRPVGSPAATPAWWRPRPARPGTRCCSARTPTRPASRSGGAQAETAGEDPMLDSSMIDAVRQDGPGPARDRRPQALRRLHPGGEPRHRTELHRRASERCARSTPAPTPTPSARRDLGSVMCSFNKINGVYACENTNTLDTDPAQAARLPRVRDHRLRRHPLHRPLHRGGHRHGDRHGSLLRRRPARGRPGRARAGVAGGPVSAEDPADHVRHRGLRQHLHPDVDPGGQHGAVAAQVENKAVTLLKNTQHALPFRQCPLGSIAVIGADANDPRALGGSAFVQPTYRVPSARRARARGPRRASASATGRATTPSTVPA